jgi:hypothetical protein
MTGDAAVCALLTGEIVTRPGRESGGCRIFTRNSIKIFTRNSIEPILIAIGHGCPGKIRDKIGPNTRQDAMAGAEIESKDTNEGASHQSDASVTRKAVRSRLKPNRQGIHRLAFGQHEGDGC